MRDTLIESRAALHLSPGAPAEIHTVEVSGPQRGEIRVAMVASGVCHSDLSVHNGTLPKPGPFILGHEGAGVVESVGDGVTAFEPGDHVVLSWVPQCGRCFYCRRSQGHLCSTGAAWSSAGTAPDGECRTRWRGEPVPQLFGVGTFAEHLVVPEMAAVKIDTEIDLRLAAFLGCAVLTGYGAATKTADIIPGDIVVVIGSGGVGLNVVQGARRSGAAEVVVVDPNAENRRLATVFGATATLDPFADDVTAAVGDLTDGRGADVVFEVVGLRSTCDQALALTRHGGETVLVGVPDPSMTLEIPAFRGLIRYGKTLKGCFYGSADIAVDVPRMVDAYLAGELLLDELLGRQVDLDDTEKALADLNSGTLARSVVVMR